MIEMPRFRIADTVLLLVVVAAAAAARIWYLNSCFDSLQEPPRLGVQDTPPVVAPADGEPSDTITPLVHLLRDQAEGTVAAPLSNQKERTAHAAPGYPWLVGRLERLTGDPGEAVALLRWGQFGLGTLTAGLYFLFARRAFRSAAVGAVAGLLCAVHPFWIIATGEIADGVLASFLLALCLLLGTRAAQEGDALCSLLYGLTLAALALTRAALLPFAAVACLWFLLRCGGAPRGWLCALLGFLGFANGLAPWTVRNWQAFGEVIPIANSTYLHLWIGVNGKATGGPQDEDTLQLTLRASRLEKLLGETNQARRYALLGEDFVARLADDPARAVDLRFRAAGCFLFGESWLDGEGMLRTPNDLLDHGWDGGLPRYVLARTPLVLEATVLVLLPLALLGWRWSYGWRRTSMPLSLAAVWIPLPYLLSHAETFSGPRLPLDGVLICYAAFALLCLVPGVGARLFRGATS